MNSVSIRKPYGKRRRRGATATEFAVLLPLLVLLCLTSVDFGRFGYAYLAVGNAGRVGAETGATRSYSDATAATWEQHVLEAAREDFSSAGGLDATQLNISTSVVPDDYTLNRVAVTTSYPFATVITWPGIPNPIDVRRTVTFRRYR